MQCTRGVGAPVPPSKLGRHLMLNSRKKEPNKDPQYQHVIYKFGPDGKFFARSSSRKFARVPCRTSTAFSGISESPRGTLRSSIQARQDRCGHTHACACRARRPSRRLPHRARVRSRWKRRRVPEQGWQGPRAGPHRGLCVALRV